MCGALAQLLKAGISPTAALETIAGSASANLKSALRDSRRAIEEGATFTTALQAVPGLLGPAEASLLFASEQIGALDRALAELAAGYDDRIRLRRRFASGLVYPALIFLVAIMVAPLVESVGELGVLGVVSGSLGSTYWGKVLPRLAALVATVAVAAVVVPRLARQPVVRRALWTLPWPATLYVRAVRGRYARMLGRALEAGLGLPQATALATRAADDPRITEASDRLSDPNHPSLLAALESAQLLDPADRMLVASGEQAGSLDAALSTVAARHSEAVQRGLGHLTLVVSAVALIGAGLLAMRTVGQGHAVLEGETDRLMKELERELPPGFRLD